MKYIIGLLIIVGAISCGSDEKDAPENPAGSNEGTPSVHAIPELTACDCFELSEKYQSKEAAEAELGSDVIGRCTGLMDEAFTTGELDDCPAYHDYMNQAMEMERDSASEDYDEAVEMLDFTSEDSFVRTCSSQMKIALAAAEVEDAPNMEDALSDYCRCAYTTINENSAGKDFEEMDMNEAMDFTNECLVAFMTAISQ